MLEGNGGSPLWYQCGSPHRARSVHGVDVRGPDGSAIASQSPSSPREVRPALLRSWVVFKLPPELEPDILHVKPSARTYTAAPHCDSHCQQLRVVLTLQFLWRQARMKRIVMRYAEMVEMLPIMGLLQILSVLTGASFIVSDHPL